MKAWILHGVNEIRFEDADEPPLAENEVLVRIKAAGICGSDIPRIYKDGAHNMPLIPGHEFSGEVVKAGKNADSAWIGKRVGIFPLIPCKKCSQCEKKRYEMCRNYNYLGSRRNGAFAEYAAVPEWNLIELPKSVSFEAAAMLEPMAVAVHAMRRVRLKKSDTAAICGLGTIGMLLLAFLKDAGIENILAVGNKEFQKSTALRLGLCEKDYCDGGKEDVARWIMERTGQSGTDAFFECVGKNETVSQAVSCTAPSGQICLLGNPHSDMAFNKGVYWKILRNQLDVSGTWNSSFTHEPDDDWHYVIERISRGRIPAAELITHMMGLGGLEKGLHLMRDKKEDYIKVMICVE